MKIKRHSVLALFFFLSGFCGLLYQTVWLRLAFASFGVITPVLSVVISVFMLGLSAGSWTGGRVIERLAAKSRASAIVWYGVVEFGIGVGAFAVPSLFSIGETLLLGTGQSDSVGYLFWSGVFLSLSIFPWCFLMGLTFPFVMAYVREYRKDETTGFSFLYSANVFGALFGTLVTALVLIETLGFRRTLWVAAGLNFLIAGLSFAVNRFTTATAPVTPSPEEGPVTSAEPDRPGFVAVILFTTGFGSMAMEVVWTRAFTPVLGNQVYAFASILFVYLLATWVGAAIYRQDLAARRVQSAGVMLAYFCVLCLLPAVVNDWKLHTSRHAWTTAAAGALGSIFPLCAVLGYLTPRLIDEYSRGDPSRAGRAYALNTVGCILGPLAASYLLLPLMGARNALVLLAFPFLVGAAWRFKALPMNVRQLTASLTLLLLVWSCFFSVGFDEFSGKGQKRFILLRDHMATVICTDTRIGPYMYVNGLGITYLTPVTKCMAHLPMVIHPSPKSALVICFGMGTTYRSLLSWDAETTAVELVPSVRDAFWYFHADTEAVLKNPKGKIVIDDGRRFLKRTRDQFDIITIDPPPPAEAAGTSLLYSEEFYESAKTRLKPGGVLHQWWAFGEPKIVQAATRSLVNTFPYVRVYRSLEGWGYHFLASTSPIQTPTPEEISRRIPPRAEMDLVEWLHEEQQLSGGGQRLMSLVFGKEMKLETLLNPDPTIRIIDDKPFNEYYVLRRLRDGNLFTQFSRDPPF